MRLLLGLACISSSSTGPVHPSVTEVAPAAVPTSHWELDLDLQMEWLAPGVWRHVSWQTLDSGLRYPSNGLLIEEEDQVLLIDTAWGERSTEALLKWSERNLGRPVSAVFSTHWHDDRLGGAAVLQTMGVPFYAHPLTVSAAKARRLPEPQAIEDLQPGQAATWFGLEIFYPGPGHTADNTMVWVPQAKLLVGGCAVRSEQAGGMGNTGDAVLSEWSASLERAKERYPHAERVLPGHGDLGNLSLLAHTQALLDQGSQAPAH